MKMIELRRMRWAEYVALKERYTLMWEHNFGWKPEGRRALVRQRYRYEDYI
jgi:hypothetical protein